MQQLKKILEPWENRIILLIFMFFALVIGLSWFKDIAIANDLSSANVHLSAVGVEALAGVLAIVISVTLMAVQFSSQEYTQRIMDSYIKSVIFWLLIFVYIFTILFDVFLLHLLENQTDLFYIKLLNTSILLTMLCFLLLIPYFLFTMKQLMPENIIRKKLMQVNKKSVKKLLQGNFKNVDKSHNKDLEYPDHVMTVSDIINKSLKSNDPITRFGLWQLSGCYDRLIREESPFYLFNIKKKVTELEDNLNNLDIPKDLKKVFETKKFPLSKNPSLKKEDKWKDKWEITTEDEIRYIIKKVDKKINIYNDGFISAHFLKHFQKIADSAKKNNNMEAIELVVDILVTMTRHPKSQETSHTIGQVIESLLEIVESAANHQFTDVAVNTVKKLVGVLNDTNKLEAYKHKLYRIGLSCSEKEKLELITVNVIAGLKKFADELYFIGASALENKQLDATRQAINELKKPVFDSEEIGETKDTIQDAMAIKDAMDRLNKAITLTSNAINLGNITFAQELYLIGTSAIKKNLYLFCWNNVPGSDSDRLIKFLKEDFTISWAEKEDIKKINNKIIQIRKGKNFANIMLNEENGKARLEINDGRNRDLMVKMNGKLNIYANLEAATIKIIRELINLSKKFSSNPEKAFNASIKAIDLILKATENKMKIHSVCNELGEYYFGAEKTETKIDLHSLGDGEWCKFMILDDKPKKVILEMKSCCIKTIKKLDDEKIQDYCRKTLAFNKQAYEEELPPVCTITHSYLTCAIKQIKSYLFSWENIPGNDNERLIRFLVDELGIKSAAGAEITKSNGGDTINIANDDYSAEIMMDANKKKAILKVSDVRTHDLIVKTEKSTLNIYKQTNVELERPIERNENGCPRLTFRVTTYLPP